MKISSQLFITLKNILLLFCFAFSINTILINSASAEAGYHSNAHQAKSRSMLASNEHDRDHDRRHHHDRKHHHKTSGSIDCPIDEVIIFFDNSVANGTLMGNGHGKSARGHLKAMRNLLNSAKHALKKGKSKLANKKLQNAYEHIVGTPHARIYVTGPAAAELASRIMALIHCVNGDTGSVTLSGTAAAGAAIVGVVTVRDSSVPFQERSAPIGDLGRYSVDVTGMTAPFMLRADGHVGLQSYSIYSAAVAEDIFFPGTINITPLTDLIISNIAGQIAAAAYASGDFGSITPASLVAEQAALLAKLEPVLIDLGIDTAVDILRATFNADHTGLDLLLDALRIEVDPILQQAIITNIINGSQTIDNFAALDPTGTLTGGGTGAGLTEIEYIRNVFMLFTDAFATSIPSPETLMHLLDPAFMFQGENVDEFITNLTTDPNLVGLNVSDYVTVESINTGAYPYTATVTFVPVFGGNQQRPLRMNLAKQTSTDPWLLTGDGRVGQAMVLARAEYRPLVANRCVGDPAILTGLNAEITSPADLNVDYALVKGNGLPAAGALWFKVPYDNHFNPAEVGAVYNRESTLRACGDIYKLDDVAISSITPNSTYTIELWDDADTADTSDDVMLYSYSDTLPVGPALNSALTSANFPAFINPATETSAADAAAYGGSFDASWTMPAGLTARNLYFYRSTDVLEQVNIDQNLLPTATSASIAGIPTPLGTVTSYGYSISAINDSNFREYRVWIGH